MTWPLLSTEQERLHAPSASSAGANRFRFEGTRGKPDLSSFAERPWDLAADFDPGRPRVKAGGTAYGMRVRKFQKPPRKRTLRRRNAKRLATRLAAPLPTR